MYYWKTMPIEERIAVRIQPNGQCREWTGGMNGAKKPEQRRPVMKKGYVSRIVWELAHGPIPEGQEVCHTCDNPRCLRTSHLFLGTHQANLDDMYSKNRQRHRHGEAHPDAKLTSTDVIAIRGMAGVHSSYGMAKAYGVSKSAILAIIHRKTWKHVA
jgi:hypothetical protein